MAIATIPVLGGITLPPPKEQNYTRHFRGGSLTMADGSIVHDLVSTANKARFRLRWEFVTDAQFSTIVTAWDAIKDTTASYTSVRGTVHTVTRPPDGEMDVEPVVVAGGDLRFHVSCELLGV